MLEVIGWITWGISALIALSLTYGAVRKIKVKQGVMKATLYQGVFLWIVVLFLLFSPSISKLNLIWIVPLCFPIIGYLTFKLYSK